MPTRADSADSASRTSPSPDYARFCTGIKALMGVDLSAYRPAQMERRLRSFAQRKGLADLDRYLELLRDDADAREAFKDRMTINVSELFRNPERWQELETRVIPELAAAARGARGLRVWSAGCSYGAEPYSLAILLRESLPGARHELSATDIDQVVLARAREGRFGAGDLRNVSPARMGRWFGPPDSEGAVQAVRELRSAIRFRKLDLLEERYPRAQDLILCRNVVIYFEEDAKRRVFSAFLEALRPGGYLLVGSTERINRFDEMGWLKGGTFLYRKPLDGARAGGRDTRAEDASAGPRRVV